MFTQKDINQIQSKELSVQDVENQIENFKKGFPFLDINKPATIDDGILKLDENEVNAYIKLYNDLNPDTIKFVPASGAASRMFKFLFEFYEKANIQYTSIDDISDEQVRRFFNEIKQFAFYNDLESVIKSDGKSIDELLEQGRFKEILEYFLFSKGLNYGEKPKGVLAFHQYDGFSRTAFEEHLYEGASYAKQSDGTVNIHFTISPEHEELFQQLIKERKADIEKELGVKFNISFSQQKPSTDMVAVDLENNLFRNDDGSLLFRPGGHGALIENLNDLESEIIFIKNIDNMVPDRIKNVTVDYKKALAGVLISYQERIFNYLNLLEEDKLKDDALNEMVDFISSELCYQFNKESKKELLQKQLVQILNRPIRVCGMVKNEGEPGGGPFWVKQASDVVNLQIVETSQINTKDDQQASVLKSATHFNPVDLVCSARNCKGEKFDLLKFRDPNTGFITKKSKDGKDLKAQELPGLWNGAMANWNTIFVEVPILTFNPVKTVNDLLRKEHQ